MRPKTKALLIGVLFLALSALDLYLPSTNNALDYFRYMFALVAFVFGWALLIKGITYITG